MEQLLEKSIFEHSEEYENIAAKLLYPNMEDETLRIATYRLKYSIRIGYRITDRDEYQTYPSIVEFYYLLNLFYLSRFLFDCHHTQSTTAYRYGEFDTMSIKKVIPQDYLEKHLLNQIQEVVDALKRRVYNNEEFELALIECFKLDLRIFNNMIFTYNLGYTTSWKARFSTVVSSTVKAVMSLYPKGIRIDDSFIKKNLSYDKIWGLYTCLFFEFIERKNRSLEIIEKGRQKAIENFFKEKGLFNDFEYLVRKYI